MSLHVNVVGSGDDVVLLHGTPTSPSHFRGLVHALSERYRVLVPHLPGYGLSPPVPFRSLGEQERQLASALRDHGVHRAHLIGFSGGVLRCLALVLSGQVEPRSIFALAGLCSATPEHRAKLREIGTALRAGADLAPMAESLYLSERFRSDPAAVAEVRGWLTDVHQETLAAELLALANEFEDLTPKLGAVCCRVTARSGTKDAAVPVEKAEELVRAVPLGTLQRVEGAGHALLVEDEAATVGAILESLETVPAT